MKPVTIYFVLVTVSLSGCFSNQSFVNNSKHPSAQRDGATFPLTKTRNDPRHFLEEHHESAECYVPTDNGIREKYLINNHKQKSLLVRTKMVIKIAGQTQRGDGKISEYVIGPGDKVNVGCEGWGIDTFTRIYSIYRQNVIDVSFLQM